MDNHYFMQILKEFIYNIPAIQGNPYIIFRANDLGNNENIRIIGTAPLI